MPRRVRGLLFVDYVRMIRGAKHIDFRPYLEPGDVDLLDEAIDPDGWYPMEAFERMGVAIVREVAHGSLEAVRIWGSVQVDQVCEAQPMLVASGDPRETLMRFQTLRHAFFDYDAIDVQEILDREANVAVAYGMGAEAEAAACHQTLGFFERLVEHAGGRDIKAGFTARGWTGAPSTRISLVWSL